MAQVSGGVFSSSVFSSFSALVAGYDTDSPPFSGVLFACDSRGFWALTPVTLNITLTDEYGYSVGYGIVTFEPNYYAWGAIIAIVAVVGVVSYVVFVRLRGGRGEVVVRL